VRLVPLLARGPSGARNPAFIDPRSGGEKPGGDSVESGPRHGRIVHDSGGERPGGGRSRLDSLYYYGG